MKYRVDKSIADILDMLVKVDFTTTRLLFVGSKYIGQRRQIETSSILTSTKQLPHSTKETDVSPQLYHANPQRESKSKITVWNRETRRRSP